MIPSRPDAFKAWADAACCRWPMSLQAMAYRAWRGLLRGDGAGHKIFCEAYEAQHGK